MDSAVIKEFLKNKKLNINTLTLNDLREKEYSGKPLNDKERLAIYNYERYRLKELNKHLNDEEFNKVFQLLQIMANLWPWEEFLNEKYST